MLLAPVRLLNVRQSGVARLPLGIVVSLAAVVLWFDFLVRGVCFPLAQPDTRTSWGGPTMAGAWSVHFALLAAFVVALHGTALALGPKVSRRSPRS
ncbi:hypothetical protein [Kitasatospora sp. NPDC056531]|uniref:hypothetical protein n=1 Tax=Kitasatospora sp. NPDC056531 TaxID=3345856 RepID=UPI0036CC5CB1